MNYHNITKDDMLNGDGLRVVLWVSGCDHHCKECQNPQTWDPESGIKFDEAAKEELYEVLSRDYISGITFSGGDPLFPGNRQEVTELAREIRERFPGKTVWLYTGFTFEQVKELEIINYLDVLVDGEFEIDKIDLQAKWRGSINQRVIEYTEEEEITMEEENHIYEHGYESDDDEEIEGMEGLIMELIDFTVDLLKRNSVIEALRPALFTFLLCR